MIEIDWIPCSVVKGNHKLMACTQSTLCILSLSLALFLHSDDCIYVCNINEYIYIYINIICSYYDYKIHDTNRYGHTGEGVRLKLQS